MALSIVQYCSTTTEYVSKSYNIMKFWHLQCVGMKYTEPETNITVVNDPITKQ